MKESASSPARGWGGWQLLGPFLQWAAALLIWIIAWTVIFSAVDFWSIKLYDVPRYSWFESYRATMRYGATLVSPASFALAENAYFVWMNMYDRSYHMHEWEWYTGNPTNPDGYYNFVWGDGRGGWTKFPMKYWYGAWLLITLAWLAITASVIKWRYHRAHGRERERAVRDCSLQPAKTA